MTMHLALLCSFCWLVPLSAVTLRHQDALERFPRHRDSHSHSQLKDSQATAPFRLDALVNQKDKERKCRKLRNYKFESSNVAGLAIARTGSTSVIANLESLPDNEHAVDHNHDCILKDVLDSGAQHVVVSLRHPVARILSGVQRRFEGYKTKKHANLEIKRSFGNFNHFLDALRDAHDKKHKKAMKMTHCWNCQNFFLPVQEFHLREEDRANVKFVCTCKLNSMMMKAAEQWGMGGKMKTSTKNGSKRSSSSAEFQKQQVSEVNRKWIEDIYAADLALYKEHCGQTCGDA